MNNQSNDDYIRSVLGYPNYLDENIYQEYNNYKTQTYNEQCNCNQYDQYNTRYDNNNYVDCNLEECYPEIYKIVYPMVKKSCENITAPITKEKLDRMADEIYSNIEGNDEIQINVNVNNNIGNTVTTDENVQNRTNTPVIDNKSVSNINKYEPKKDYSSTYTKTYETLKKEINEKLENRGNFKYTPEPKRETRYNQGQMQEKRFNLEPQRDVRINPEKNPDENRGEDRSFNRGLSDLIRILLIRELTGRPVFPGNRPPYGPPPPPPGRPPFGPPPPRYY